MRIRDPLTNALVSLGTFPTRAQANRALTIALADQSRGAWVDPAPGREPLRDYAHAWIAHHPGLRPRTRRLYQDLLRLHILPKLGDIDIRKLTPRLVRTWYAGLVANRGPGQSTAAKAYRLLHAIMATATADELVTKNSCVLPGEGRERPAERPVISVAQVYELANAVEPRFRVLILTAAFTGLRRGELFGLTRARIDLLHSQITVFEQRQQSPTAAFWFPIRRPRWASHYQHASPAAALRYQHATEQRDRVIAQALGELIVSSPELERPASVASLPSSR